jgi:hypothetical protein
MVYIGLWFLGVYLRYRQKLRRCASHLLALRAVGGVSVYSVGRRYRQNLRRLRVFGSRLSRRRDVTCLCIGVTSFTPKSPGSASPHQSPSVVCSYIFTFLCIGVRRRYRQNLRRLRVFGSCLSRRRFKGDSPCRMVGSASSLRSSALPI